ncbi:FAD-binding protein [Endozoicomonas elysicola]|uniref:Delta 4, 5-alpha steroid dehydrogenase n=1 Tax=Endozoicomonas elysicola TaxID=305900 RepID=A0A081KA49_9GAMM|nr:FAD-binding protein [Endozoicomonas elysicola]KEI71025.1 delta 4, 5-alpha steroid dehydrogenase [Endozoicomonas elysicola]
MSRPSEERNALKVESADQIQWHDERDVVVVGFGGSGVAAALEARYHRVSVLALDRFFGGGATARSGGVVYSGGGTEFQKAEGFDDTPEEMFNYLRQETGDAVKEETLKRFCDQSATNLRWLQSHNVEFSGQIPPVKTSYPSDKYYLYYSGNEAVGSYAKHAKPAPRGHRAKGPGLSGASLFAPLKASALARGVELQVQSDVRRLVCDESGSVLGVEVRRLMPGTKAARNHKRWSNLATAIHNYSPKLAFKVRGKVRALEESAGVVQYIRARKGVVLTAGGFIFNREMVKQYGPKYQEGLSLGTTGCDGSGIQMGMGADAAIDRMDKLSAWRFINPPLAWAQGIVVNDHGERYCNEEVYGAKLGYEMVEHHNGRATLILNKDLFKQAFNQVLPGKIWFFQTAPALMSMYLNCKKASSIAELAKKIKVPEGALAATIQSYTDAAKGLAEDELGKSSGFLAPLDQGPWYAMDISFNSSVFPCPMITLGGLKVNEETGQVLDQKGDGISGLYSAGRNAIGVASNLYVSGLSIADCIFSGRRAGSSVARVGEKLVNTAEQSASKEAVNEAG